MDRRHVGMVEPVRSRRFESPAFLSITCTDYLFIAMRSTNIPSQLAMILRKATTRMARTRIQAIDLVRRAANVLLPDEPLIHQRDNAGITPCPLNCYQPQSSLILSQLTCLTLITLTLLKAHWHLLNFTFERASYLCCLPNTPPGSSIYSSHLRLWAEATTLTALLKCSFKFSFTFTFPFHCQINYMYSQKKNGVVRVRLHEMNLK